MRASARHWPIALVLAVACRSGDSAPPPASAPTDSPTAQAPAGAPEPTPPAAKPLPPLPNVAVLDETVRTAKARAQSEVLAKSEPPQPELQPLPEGGLPGPALAADPMPGFFTPLTMPPEGDPLAPFHEALAALEAGTRTEPVRLAMYGASGTAVDLWTGYLRRYLQARFGDAGPGIVSAAPHNRWYRHHELSIKSSKHWKKHNAYRRSGEDDPGLYGPMGVCHDTSNKRAWAEIRKGRRAPADRSLSYYEILHLLQPGGGTYRVELGGDEVADVATALAAGERQPKIGSHRVDVAAGQPTLRLEATGDGPIRMLGVIAETGQPGVVVDTLGIDGAKITNQLLWDEALWAEGIRRREPVLYVLAFGTNASVNEEENPLAEWEQGFRTVLERFRKTLPDAGCVVFGPGDYPIVEGDQVLPRPRLNEIREIERKLAPEFGCAHWDALSFVGGEGAKPAWVEAGLARDDYLHLTRAGYVRLGIGFADALMQRYDWRRQHNPDR
ncbi:MAG: GDSL-type esterase/lipase family protein [Myxococcota bacterium]